MYITSIKKGTAPRIQTETSSIIDELFGDAPVATDSIPNKFYRTVTKEVDTNALRAPDNYTSNVLWYKLRLNNYLAEHNVNEMYREFKIPKRTGGFRTIDAPEDDLKMFMREFSNTFLKTFKLLTHDSAFAYIKGRSVIDAVKEHQNNKSRWFLKIDLKDFFGSCNKEFIVNQLYKIYPFALGGTDTIDLLNSLADLSCLNNKLPQGTPISPWLTNLIMIEFDYKINKLLNKLANDETIKKQRYVYTRYADDILISAKEKFDYQLVIEELKEIFEGTPLTIKDEKTRFGSSAGRNWNLGIMYNKDNTLTIGHKKKRQIKDNIYYFIKFKDTFELEDCWWLQGNISWLKSVEPEYTEGLLTYYKNKFDIDVWQTLLDKIKSFNN